MSIEDIYDEVEGTRILLKNILKIYCNSFQMENQIPSQLMITETDEKTTLENHS